MTCGPRKELYPMRSIRLLAAGASALALFVSACSTGGAPSPTTAAAPPTTAPKPAAASPAAAPSASAAVSASPSAAASPAAAAAASPKPVASPAASPAAALASPSAAASPVAAAGGPKPTIRIGSFNFTESVVLRELYAQVLEANGYTVQPGPSDPARSGPGTGTGPRESLEPSLASGQLDLIPEYMATAEAYEAGLVNQQSKASSDPAATQTAYQALLTPKQLTVLDFAQAVDTNGFVVTAQTASKYNLTKLSDLAPVASQLTMGGPPECGTADQPNPQRPFCLTGL